LDRGTGDFLRAAFPNDRRHDQPNAYSETKPAGVGFGSTGCGHATRRNLRDGWMPYFYDAPRYRDSVEKIKGFAAAAGREISNFQWAHFPYIAIYPTEQEAAEVAARQLGGRYLYGGEFLDIVRKYCLLGTVENCVEQLQEYIDAGARHIVFSISCPMEDRERHLEVIAKELIPRFQSK